MAAWTADELTAIGGADELRIAPLRDDGTLRNPVTIWVVRLGDEPDPATADAIDAVYEDKYSRYDRQFLDPMVAQAARAATVKLVPR